MRRSFQRVFTSSQLHQRGMRKGSFYPWTNQTANISINQQHVTGNGSAFWKQQQFRLLSSLSMDDNENGPMDDEEEDLPFGMEDTLFDESDEIRDAGAVELGKLAEDLLNGSDIELDNLDETLFIDEEEMVDDDEEIDDIPTTNEESERLDDGTRDRKIAFFKGAAFSPDEVFYPPSMNMDNQVDVRIPYGDQTASLNFGSMATQADSSCILTIGDTSVLAAVAVATNPTLEADFLPLQVEYIEKGSAGGIIPGSINKRERQSENEILASRVIDRSIRPLFRKGFVNATDVVITVLSYDGENDPVVAGINAAIAALSVSSLPWRRGRTQYGVSAVRIGRIGGEFIINPKEDIRPKCDLDLVLTGNSTSICMLEGRADEITEEDFNDAMAFGRLYANETATMLRKVESSFGYIDEEMKVSRWTYGCPNATLDRIRNLCYGFAVRAIVEYPNVTKQQREFAQTKRYNRWAYEAVKNDPMLTPEDIGARAFLNNVFLHNGIQRVFEEALVDVALGTVNSEFLHVFTGKTHSPMDTDNLPSRQLPWMKSGEGEIEWSNETEMLLQREESMIEDDKDAANPEGFKNDGEEVLPRQYQRPETMQTMNNAIYKLESDSVAISHVSKPFMRPNTEREPSRDEAGNLRRHKQPTCVGERIDGRNANAIRPINCKVDVLPVVHGSAIFGRGNTEVLGVVTLGRTREQMKKYSYLKELDEDEDHSRFFLHYNFPGYSINKVEATSGKLGRRELGHGNLAENAMVAVLPGRDGQEYPYTVRANSEVLSSDGSTSMASVCATSLALMDAGVPIKRHVAGISIGLFTREAICNPSKSRYQLITDILGLEDHFGMMDFKIAGTRKGITAVQLDTKAPAVHYKILQNALAKAKGARGKLLDKMEAVMPEPRKKDNVPRYHMLNFGDRSDLVGRLIGQGGRNFELLRNVAGKDCCHIEILDDDRTVSIYAKNKEALDKTLEAIKEIINAPELAKAKKPKSLPRFRKDLIET